MLKTQPSSKEQHEPDDTTEEHAHAPRRQLFVHVEIDLPLPSDFMRHG